MHRNERTRDVHAWFKKINVTPDAFSCQHLSCSSTSVCDMIAVYSRRLAHSPWQALQSLTQSRCPAASRERSLKSPPLRLCSFLSHSYSPSLCRPLPDNAVTTCGIKQPQPGWQMCGSVTAVKDLVDVWQRQCNPSGYVLYVEGAVSLCQHSRLTVRRMWLWYLVFFHMHPCARLAFCPQFVGFETLNCVQGLA